MCIYINAFTHYINILNENIKGIIFYICGPIHHLSCSPSYHIIKDISPFCCNSNKLARFLKLQPLLQATKKIWLLNSMETTFSALERILWFLSQLIVITCIIFKLEGKHVSFHKQFVMSRSNCDIFRKKLCTLYVYRYSLPLNGVSPLGILGFSSCYNKIFVCICKNEIFEIPYLVLKFYNFKHKNICKPNWA